MGDTLPKLAARYLGDRERYLEIYHANEHLLGDPRLLPIGCELEIPARSAGTTEDVARTSQPTEASLDDALLDALFGEPDKKEEAANALEPIPPDRLPPRDFGAWQYSAR